MEAPWSRAAPVKLCTRCKRLSRDLAGLVGALTPRGGAGAAVVGGAFPKLSDNSGAAPVGCGGTWPGAGGGGMFGGPPATFGLVGWSCIGRAAGGKLLGSTSSTSEDKSPELNLCVCFQCWVDGGCELDVCVECVDCLLLLKSFQLQTVRHVDKWKVQHIRVREQDREKEKERESTHFVWRGEKIDKHMKFQISFVQLMPPSLIKKWATPFKGLYLLFRKLTLEVKLDLNDEKFRVLLFGSFIILRHAKIQKDNLKVVKPTY